MESAAQNGAITIIRLITNNYLKRNSALIKQLQQRAQYTPLPHPRIPSSLLALVRSHFSCFSFTHLFCLITSHPLTQTSLPFLHLLSADQSFLIRLQTFFFSLSNALFIYVEGHAGVSAPLLSLRSGRLTIPSASLLIYHPNGRYK